jgi:hypothetical protein
MKSARIGRLLSPPRHNEAGKVSAQAGIGNYRPPRDYRQRGLVGKLDRLKLIDRH